MVTRRPCSCWIALTPYRLRVRTSTWNGSAWEVQFGNHHLGINATENSLTFAPTHLGSQPAVYTDAEGVDLFRIGQQVAPIRGAELTSPAPSSVTPAGACEESDRVLARWSTGVR